MPRDIFSRKYHEKKASAAGKGIAFDLTKAEVKELLVEAGIGVDDWCQNGYHLARIGDTGGYVIGNCRFIPAICNIRERKASRKSIDAAVINLKRFWDSVTPERAAEIRTLSGKAGGHRGQQAHNRLTADMLVAKFDLVKHLGALSPGFAVEAAKILGCSSAHVRRLRKRWLAMGIVK